MAKSIYIPVREKKEQYTLEELYREYQPKLQVILRRIGSSNTDEDDIIQDAFIDIMAYWDRIDWKRVEGMLSIILGAARADFYSKVTRHSNRETRNFNIDFESHDKGVLDPMRLILRHEFIEDSLTVLSETEKQVFLGYYIRGKSIKDLTNGKSPGTIKTLLYRIREKLIAYHNPEIKE